MFQVTFSDQSLAELKKIGTLEQLEVISPLSQLTESQLAVPKEPLGRFSRGKKTIYRLRSGEYRIYFERDGITLHTACILHKNTLTDFVFRTKLPISEEQLVEQHSSFWKYLETLTRSD
ncbi:MAG: cytotoxic translational repressor of toxin-antitoxin stability system [Opitutales bacterium]|nr:cytotoxic translational repressor of toxin-antitoxin stability system [Opitutales bacterium]|tara:strand:- start:168 stop:524 length:357 start_codon:yes stop_codon:yes gene_type:complete